ncbi:MAG TPA: hypothetical protein VK468_04265 [Pyrinomonadaceae bacterium]|nr:hypothetical protein [Pyrinomonadaceae bacterium]
MTNEKKVVGNKKGREISFFLQAEGLDGIRVVNAQSTAKLKDFLADLSGEVGGNFAAAVNSGQMVVTLEDEGNEFSLASTLEHAGIRDRSRVHAHRCRKVKVTVNFNGEAISDDMPPSTRVEKVKKWSIKEFDIDKVEATEHALQLCGTADRPDEDTHIGTLTTTGSCSVCFDLVPKVRVEGALN